VHSAGAQESTGRPAAGTHSVRLDVVLMALLLAGVVAATWLPFRTASYYIDWISGAMFGAMIGGSEGYLTALHFRDRLAGPVLRLRCRRGIPEGTGSVAGLIALLGAGYLVFVALPGPISALTKTPLFTFNFVCGTWWTMWLVYLGALLAWAVRQRRRLGCAVRAVRSPAD
jgi:hypothetical protein